MEKIILINVGESSEQRVGVTEDGKLTEFYIQSNTDKSLIGNIYKGKIDNYVKSLKAFFVNIGIDKNAFLPRTEAMKKYKKGDEVIVQVFRDMIENKGPSVTSYISISGRYLVLTPFKDEIGVSKKISDKKIRFDLKKFLKSILPKESPGFIIRTTGSKRKKTEIRKELKHLHRIWEIVKQRAKSNHAPVLIYEESDLITKAIREVYSSDIKKVIVDSYPAYLKLKELFKVLLPKQTKRISLYESINPIFTKYNIEEQVEQVYKSRVTLKSGAFIIIEPTSALTSFDINTGKFTANLPFDELSFKVNLEAAEEIARQIMLRNIGGQIVIDFIFLKDKKKFKYIEKKMKEFFKTDKSTTTILPISNLGLMEIAREKDNNFLSSFAFSKCDKCTGTGYMLNIEAAAAKLFRQIKVRAYKLNGDSPIIVAVHPQVLTFIQNNFRKELLELEKTINSSIQIVPSNDVSHEQIKFKNILD